MLWQTVSSWRNDTLYTPLCKLITDFANRNKGKAGDFEFEWGAVSVMSEEEKLDARKKQAETMKMYYDMGVITSDEMPFLLTVEPLK